jgi:uncharacterized membrane protein
MMGTEAQGGWSLASLPDNLVALIWPPKMIPEGVCVCNQGLARALRAALSLDLSGRSIRAEGAKALAGTERCHNTQCSGVCVCLCVARAWGECET